MKFVENSMENMHTDLRVKGVNYFSKVTKFLR